MRLLSIFMLFCFALHLHSQNINYEYDINWSEQSSGVNTRLNCVSGSQYGDYNVAFVCGENGVVLKTTNAGLNWINISSNGLPGDIDLTSVSMFNGNIALVSGITGNTAYVYKTSNGGLNWRRIFAQENGDIKTVRVIDPLYSFIIGNPVGERWSIWKSSDFGESWDSAGMYLPQQNGEKGLDNSVSIVGDFNNNYRIWIGTNNNRIYYSSNTGVNWIVQQMPEQSIYSICSIGRYLMCGGNSFYSSDNNGSLWQAEPLIGSGIINGIIYPGVVVIMPQDNLMNGPKLIIRNGNSIYYNEGSTGEGWENVYSVTSGNFTNMTSSFDNIWVLRDNGGITYGKIDIITSVPPNNYPYSFELKQNYPNPFNPKTKIRIIIHKQAAITVNVYNSSGKWINTFYSPKADVTQNSDNIIIQQAYEYEWDGTNYPSGVYFYEVVADDYREARKMILVK